VTRGEIYRTHERIAERGSKPGYYVVVSRSFIALNEDISTVVCAPIYSEVLGVSTEVIVGQGQGIPRVSAIRCDFLTLLFKSKLSTFVGELSIAQCRDLDRALKIALAIHA
jgi:mRNA-degrading endonuclease toxin of MazEF toxin-antitoxin module